jgi:hypothetical protein
MVDLPVPRSPKTMTPPIPGSVAAISIANFISSWPTMAEKGKVGFRGLSLFFKMDVNFY